MLCEACHKREAMVHLTTAEKPAWLPKAWLPQEQHLCQECAEAYFASTPGMNSSRGLICLSDSYRSKLYDMLETAHPEAFDNHDTEVCRRGSKLMTNFLCEHLKK